MKTVFIDGSAGTTGLQIYERLKSRTDLRLLTLSDTDRKDPAARKAALNAADVSVLCLPADAAREAAAMTENGGAVLIDASTAHRTDPAWVYGMPELPGQYARIRDAKRIANPGCHASGFIALIAPLRHAGLLPRDAMLTCCSLTGYSGGGKKMIAAYEAPDRPAAYEAPRVYGLTQAHKHLPEMQKYADLDCAPVFIPTVAPFYAGMLTTVGIFPSALGTTKQEITELLSSFYPANGRIHYAADADPDGFLSANALAGRDDMQISAFGTDDRLLLAARFDNLGKGASGAAVRNLEIVLHPDGA
ncbi:MAG: N-acetyl-gamma-glutamyl-phosphate reductase [Clostridia bacterium]|nr:N-acetyl-gamma-glutamyl-phosphate reductase [Clostridia bacterium]